VRSLFVQVAAGFGVIKGSGVLHRVATSVHTMSTRCRRGRDRASSDAASTSLGNDCGA
jgi:hypothetical protein